MASAMRTGGLASAPARTVVRPRHKALALQRRELCKPTRAIEIDLSDADTQIALAGIVLGIAAGIGAPLWYINRSDRDAEKLEEVRALNRANFEATGEYLKDEEIAQLRKPKWTDRREWQDDD